MSGLRRKDAFIRFFCKLYSVIPLLQILQWYVTIAFVGRLLSAFSPCAFSRKQAHRFRCACFRRSPAIWPCHYLNDLGSRTRYSVMLRRFCPGGCSFPALCMGGNDRPGQQKKRQTDGDYYFMISQNILALVSDILFH